MADVEVTRGDVSISLTLNEEEALFVVGVLGHALGDVPPVYRELTQTLREAGYDSEALYAMSDKYQVVGRA